MSYKIDINVDLGEGFGIYRLTNDEEVMKYISSVNIACGFHAGDPHIMREMISLCRKYGVEPGAHPGLPDMIGFGRRRINVSPQELADYVIYQAGALRAFAKSVDLELQHVLIHGIACVMCWYEEPYAKAYTSALTELDPTRKLIMYGNRGGPGSRYVLDAVAREAGLKVVPYIIADMEYHGDGSVVMTRTHEPVDVKERTSRMIRVIKEGIMRDAEGNDIKYEPKSILVHSDTPNVVELLQNIRREFRDEGIDVVPMKELV